MTMGNHIADEVARFGGSWTFIISFGCVLAVYTAINVWLGRQAWDPYPFILLNLFLSMLASVQAPVIMMSQNRQASKDRLQADQDYQVNIKAEFAIQQLHRKLDEMRASLMQHRRAELEHWQRTDRPR
jgi:CRP/FNR family transcriptional regulator, cyclic AMP receptor protein